MIGVTSCLFLTQLLPPSCLLKILKIETTKIIVVAWAIDSEIVIGTSYWMQREQGFLV